jgi:hypothetical protein
MHRESIYVCSYAQGRDRITGRVRAWDGREAAQLFAAELKAEDGTRQVAARDVLVEAPPGGSRRKAPRSRRR